ncbi:MAG TPA: class II fructose-1,6-bisphosphate aldolase [Candidatus Portnoybacteria bacterium]|nr:class II fructose-1,6-bisphosphate aldolase [Candidatus Portnoybacteria bacterium]
MLVSVKKLLEDAQEKGYALGAFNTSNLEVSQAIIKAAEVQKSPVSIQVSETTIDYAGFKPIVNLIKSLAEQSEIPLVLHLDHGRSYETAVRCIEANFSSVMIDGSALPFEENVKLTKRVVDYAHQQGVWVQGELGRIPKAEESSKSLVKIEKTSPGEAKKFVQLTKVDALAIAIGNVHGVHKKGRPRLDFDRLKKIHQLVKAPLVLHGGSGISEQDIKKAISLGITKINIDTEIRIAFTGALEKLFKKGIDTVDPRKILALARQAVQKKVEEKIKIFGSAGKV